MKLTPLFTLAALFGSVALSTAQEAPATTKPERPVPPYVLKKFDKDGDGKLNDEEKAALTAERKAKAEERQKALVAKYDKDGDGKLSPEELSAVREDRKKERIAKFDKDGDGKLNAEEMEAAKAARGDRKGPPPAGE